LNRLNDFGAFRGYSNCVCHGCSDQLAMVTWRWGKPITYRFCTVWKASGTCRRLSTLGSFYWMRLSANATVFIL